MIEKILGRIHRTRGVGEQVWFAFNTVGKSGESRNSRKMFAIYTLISKLGNSISRKQTDTRLLYKYERLFFLRTGNLIINWVTFSLLQTYCA